MSLLIILSVGLLRLRWQIKQLQKSSAVRVGHMCRRSSPKNGCTVHYRLWITLFFCLKRPFRLIYIMQFQRDIQLLIMIFDRSKKYWRFWNGSHWCFTSAKEKRCKVNESAIRPCTSCNIHRSKTKKVHGKCASYYIFEIVWKFSFHLYKNILAAICWDQFSFSMH